MLYALYCLDRPGAKAQREVLLGRHLAHLALLGNAVVVAGPLHEDDGRTLAGSLLVADFEDRAALDAWLEGEPFQRDGVYASVTIRPFVDAWPKLRTGMPPQGLDASPC